MLEKQYLKKVPKNPKKCYLFQLATLADVDDGDGCDDDDDAMRYNIFYVAAIYLSWFFK